MHCGYLAALRYTRPWCCACFYQLSQCSCSLHDTVHWGIGKLLLQKAFAKRPLRSLFSVFLHNYLRWLTKIDAMSVPSAWYAGLCNKGSHTYSKSSRRAAGWSPWHANTDASTAVIGRTEMLSCLIRQNVMWLCFTHSAEVYLAIKHAMLLWGVILAASDRVDVSVRGAN